MSEPGQLVGVKRMRVALSWSSGKDSAWALHVLRQRPEIEVATLFTTMNDAFGRVAMHAVRRDLVRQQAQAAGLPLLEVPIPYPCSNAEYESIMSKHVEELKSRNIGHIAFGDLFLEEIRRYRERQLEGSGLTPLFPLWGEPTARLARSMVAAGVRAVITCVDPRRMAVEYSGRLFDAALLASLADDVDPCGENGEFHTFAFDGPMFRHPIDIAVGETISRDGFVFTDLLPGQRRSPGTKAGSGISA